MNLVSRGFPIGEAKIEWLVDGVADPDQHSPSFRTDGLKRGDSVQAKVTIGGEALVSNAVVLSNAPPVVESVNFVPRALGPGDSLGVETSATDPDGDEIILEYAWEINGEPSGRESRIREDVALKRNDVLTVTITPFDGHDRGAPITLRRTIQNVPPTIDGLMDARWDGDAYSCRVQARDGDGDPLVYALKKAPPGMSVEPSTGAIRWTVPGDLQGKVPVTVSVSDGNGGEASYDLFLTIGEEPPQKGSPPDRPSGRARTAGTSGQ
ncbi:MAG TPA: putative Ig domain-containing protein [Candidatus Aquicultoraceae bacterium]|nr:putative Ig domain-containing protein [Candidatus Aquicultoraceae bacterium]